jgi:hypothetical protein
LLTAVLTGCCTGRWDLLIFDSSPAVCKSFISIKNSQFQVKHQLRIASFRSSIATLLIPIDLFSIINVRSIFLLPAKSFFFSFLTLRRKYYMTVSIRNQ